MTDLDRYLQRKKENLSQIVKVGDAFAIKEKRYNQETGEEIQPELDYIDVKGLVIRKKQLEDELNKINEFLGDINSVDKKVINSIKKELNYG
jgi:hypothetical protein